MTVAAFADADDGTGPVAATLDLALELLDVSADADRLGVRKRLEVILAVREHIAGICMQSRDVSLITSQIDAAPKHP